MSNNATAELASQILAFYTTPVGTAPVFSSFATSDAIGASIAALEGMGPV